MQAPVNDIIDIHLEKLISLDKYSSKIILSEFFLKNGDLIGKKSSTCKGGTRYLLVGINVSIG